MTEDAPWLSPDETLTWVHLTSVLSTLPAALDAQLKRDSGLNFFEYSIMVALSAEPERTMPVGRLASFAWGSPSRLSHAMSRFERQGYVVRRECGGRSVEATLTDEGFAALAAAAPGHVREVRRLVFDGLTAEQGEQLGAACRAMLAGPQPEALAVIDEAVRAARRRRA